jgi:hypothetical protein
MVPALVSRRAASRPLTLAGLAGAFSLLLPSLAAGHARLLTPPPRSPSSSLKVPECGNVARTASSTKLTQGQTLTVSWEETVDHPGCFIVDVSPAGDSNWRTIQIFPDDATGALPHPFSKQVTLPADLVCDQCTLRLRQIMKAGTPCPPAAVNPTVDVYYSCADVTISALPDLAMPAPADLATTGPVPDLAVPPTDVGGGAVTGCSAGAAPVGAGAGLLGLLLGPAALLLRRRRAAAR